MTKITTIERFILDNQPQYAKGDCTVLLDDMALAAKVIAPVVNVAGR